MIELYEVSNHEKITFIFHSTVFILNFASSTLFPIFSAIIPIQGIVFISFIIVESLSRISL